MIPISDLIYPIIVPIESCVYQTDQNVVRIINTRPDYRGQKPKPPEPDTTLVN